MHAPYTPQDAVPSERRTVLLEGGRPTPGFGHNGIKTAKYNPVTFAPIFLFEMFSRAAYLYFLIQVRQREPNAEAAFLCHDVFGLLAHKQCRTSYV